MARCGWCRISVQYSTRQPSSISTGRRSPYRRSSPSCRGPEIQNFSPVSMSRMVGLEAGPLQALEGTPPVVQSASGLGELDARPIRARPVSPSLLSSMYMIRAFISESRHAQGRRARNIPRARRIAMAPFGRRPGIGVLEACHPGGDRSTEVSRKFKTRLGICPHILASLHGRSGAARSCWNRPGGQEGSRPARTSTSRQVSSAPLLLVVSVVRIKRGEIRGDACLFLVPRK
jgi:hypothetical protein